MFSPSDFKGKKACVLGLGKSGRAAVELLCKQKFKVLASTSSFEVSALPKGVEVELGEHTERVLECDFIVKSPGMFPNTPILKKARAQKIPIFSEVEVALSFLPLGCQIFAISGTNGKTTTTMLLTEILREYCSLENKGRQVFTLGNIGTPASTLVQQVKKGDLIVIEMSSYQLEDSTYFAPNVSALLNITEDHIDHHGSFKKYMAAKKKLFKFQKSKDIAIINAADKNCLTMIKGIKPSIYSFATTPLKTLRSHVFFDGDEIVFSHGERLSPPNLPGVHNVENAMAAALMALSQGVGQEIIQKAFDSFKGAEHRVETFLTYKGIVCINDSKATNIDSTITALKAVGSERKIWLILGGRDKGSSYEILLPYLHKHCKKVLTIGESMEKIKSELKGEFSIYECGVLEIAVKYAFKHAKKGDVLLLSPACASFDQFENFEQRGHVFKKICVKIAKENK